MTDPAAARSIRVATVILAAAFALLAALVGLSWQPLIDLDRTLLDKFASLGADHSLLHYVARGLAYAGHPNAVLLLTILGAGALWTRRQRRAATWAVAVVLVARLLAIVLKAVVHRPRPGNSSLIGSDSFPSGHATAAAAAAAVLAVLVAVFIRRRGLRRLAIGIGVVIAAAVGLSRLVLGVHYPSDVLGGWLFGPFVALVAYLVYDPRPRSIAIGMIPLPNVAQGDPGGLAVVVNPTKLDDIGQFKYLVESMATDAGITEVSWWETTAEDPGLAMAHEAAVSGASLVLAVGGDGTIRAVCEELAGTGIPVGVIPAGTGNLFARNLNIPLYLRSAIDVAINGQDHAVDMVEVFGDDMDPAVFLVMAGMGLDAMIMEGVNEGIKAKVGWLAYVWSAFKALMFPPLRVEISVDGEPFTKHRARTVVIGNVGYLQAGMPLIPSAELDDGLLDVVVLYPASFLSWIPLAARVLTKNRRTDQTITRMKGRSVVIRTNSDAPRQLDGDPIAPGRELRAKCVHGRLLVRVPR